jgi:hypothetical protein
MAATTQHAFYNGVLTRLRDKCSLTDRYIYLAFQPILDPKNKQCVQVIPGAPRAEDPRSGGGLIWEDFRLAYWSRLMLDSSPHDDLRIADTTHGLLVLADDCRDALMQAPASVATVPITFIGGTVMSRSDDHEGWVYSSDTFRAAYELGWELEA